MATCIPFNVTFRLRREAPTSYWRESSSTAEPLTASLLTGTRPAASLQSERPSKALCPGAQASGRPNSVVQVADRLGDDVQTIIGTYTHKIRGTTVRLDFCGDPEAEGGVEAAAW